MFYGKLDVYSDHYKEGWFVDKHGVGSNKYFLLMLHDILLEIGVVDLKCIWLYQHFFPLGLYHIWSKDFLCGLGAINSDCSVGDIVFLFFLSFGLASEVPKLTHYGVV